MKKEITAIVGEYSDRVSFWAHVENGELVVDQCDGINPLDALAIFPEWAVEEVLSPPK